MQGYLDEDGMAAHSSSAGNSVWIHRFMQRRRYTRLHGGGGSKHLRIAKLGRRKSKGVLAVPRSNGKGVLAVPRSNGKGVLAVPRRKLRVVRSAAKSLGTRIRDAYADMMMGFAGSCRIGSKPARRTAAQDFNTKVVIAMYKSLGIQLQPCPGPRPKTAGLIM